MLLLILVNVFFIRWVNGYPYPLGAPWPHFGGQKNDFSSDLLYQDTSNIQQLASYTLDAAVVAPGVIDAEGTIYVATREDSSIPKVFAIERLDPDSDADRSTYEFDSVFTMEIGVEEQVIRNSPVLAVKDRITQLAIFGCDGQEVTLYDYSQIIAISTNNTEHPTAKLKKNQGWQYPTDEEMSEDDYDIRIGQIFGSGVIDDYQHLYWGTSEREIEEDSETETTITEGLGHNSILELDVVTGTLIQRCEMPYGVYSTPLIHGDYLFVVSGGIFYRLTRSEDGLDCDNPAQINLLDECPNSDFYSDEDEIDTTQAPRNMPIIGPNDEIIVAFSNCVFRIDPDSMGIYWQYVGDDSKGIYWNSPCVSWHGNIYAANVRGDVAALRSSASSSTNSLNDRYSPDVYWTDNFNDKFYGPPLCLGGNTDEPVVHIVGESGYLFTLGEDGTLIGGDAEDTGYQIDGSYENKLGHNLIQDQNGFLYLASVIKQTLLMFGGGNLAAGGCSKGTEANNNVTEAYPYPCTTCPAGYINKVAATGTCSMCPAGYWAGDARTTFCFICEVDWWCPGGADCLDGRGGAACARCSENYFSIGKLCRECPANSAVTTVPVVFLIILILVMIFRYTGANAYVTGTKFTYEIKEGDTIRLEFKENDQTITAQSRVKKVVTDYILEVEKSFGNSEPICDAKFMILVRNMDGAGKTRFGTGKVSVPKKTGGKPQGDSMSEKALLFVARYICGKTVTIDREAQKKLYRPEKVFGKTTSGTQVLGAAVVIGVTWLQMTTLFMEFNLGWPDMLGDIFGIFGNIAFFNVPDLLTAPECEWSTTYISDWFMSVFIPVILVGFFVVMYALAYKMYKNPATLGAIRDRCFQAALIVIIVMYVLITAKAWEPLDCTIQDDDNRYMDADPSYICEMEGEYFIMGAFAVIMFIFYGVGIPLHLYRTLTSAKKKNKMGDIQFIQRYGWMYLRYNRDFYYWEIVVLLRKLFIVIWQKLFNADPEKQAKACIGTLAIACFWHFKTKPFTCYECIKHRKKRCKHVSANDLMEGGSLLAQLLVLSLGLLSYQYSDGGTQVTEASEAITICMVVVVVIMVLSLGIVIGRSVVEQEIEKKKLEQDGISFEKEKGIGYLQHALG